MSIHHTQKKKYQGMKDAGKTAQEIKAEMLANEISEADADSFISALYDPAGEQPSQNEQPESNEPKAKKGGLQAKSTTPIYEEWKMTLTYDADGRPVLDKSQKVKEVKIDHNRAERLNEQAENRRVKYFLKQN